jgi:hypothetical protein
VAIIRGISWIHCVDYGKLNFLLGYQAMPQIGKKIILDWADVKSVSSLNLIKIKYISSFDIISSLLR